MSHLRIMVSRHSAFYSPLIVTIAAGFLEKVGLSATYYVVGEGTSTVDEVSSGRMDIGQAAVSASWSYLEKSKKPPVAHFAQINSRDGFIIASRSKMKQFHWDDLKKGNFLYVHGGQPAAMLRYGLHKKDVELIRDPDVLDTWFSSGLWPFATLGWPDEKDFVKKFYPTTVLVTGFDIIFFWVARMMMFGMEFLNKEPFKDIYVHALVKDEKGQKMSKSKGNVIDPLDLIEKYSADALRFTLLSMASPGTDVKLSEDRVKGYRNFLNKLWNANNFLITNECDFKKTNKVPKTTLNINKWIYSELIQTKDIIEKNLKDYRFDEAAKNAYQFAWHSYCDWYIELSKTILFSDDEKSKKEVKEVSVYIFKQILVILHPFIPFVTEKIWLKNKFDKSNKNFLMHANWPSGKSKKDQSMKDVEKIINVISELRLFKNELNVSPGSFIDISINKINKKNKTLMTNNEIILKKLGRINNFFDKDQQKPSATLVISGDIFKIYFDENVDLNLIKENLVKRQNKYQEEMDKISQRLSNKGFTDRAPKNIVEQEKTNYSNLKDDIKKISLTIESL